MLYGHTFPLRQAGQSSWRAGSSKSRLGQSSKHRQSRGVEVNPEGLWSPRRRFESARDYGAYPSTNISFPRKATGNVDISGPIMGKSRSHSSRHQCRSGSVVRPIISAFRAEDSGSNPGRSISLLKPCLFFCLTDDIIPARMPRESGVCKNLTLPGLMALIDID